MRCQAPKAEGLARSSSVDVGHAQRRDAGRERSRRCGRMAPGLGHSTKRLQRRPGPPPHRSNQARCARCTSCRIGHRSRDRVPTPTGGATGMEQRSPVTDGSVGSPTTSETDPSTDPRRSRGKCLTEAPPDPKAKRGKGWLSAPDRIRTCDLMLRRHALYPTELRAQICPCANNGTGFSPAPIHRRQGGVRQSVRVEPESHRTSLNCTGSKTTRKIVSG